MRRGADFNYLIVGYRSTSAIQALRLRQSIEVLDGLTPLSVCSLHHSKAKCADRMDTMAHRAEWRKITPAEMRMLTNRLKKGVLEKRRRGRDFPSLVLGEIMKDKSIVELLAEIESRCEKMRKEVEEARKFDWNVFLK